MKKFWMCNNQFLLSLGKTALKLFFAFSFFSCPSTETCSSFTLYKDDNYLQKPVLFYNYKHCDNDK